MKSLDELIRNVPPGGTVVVRAAFLGMGEGAFNRLASEIQDDDGVDDFDFVKAHRLGDTGWQHLDTAASASRPVDALTLRRRRD
jgi:hypothetical protein